MDINFYHLSPEIAILALAIVIILADLVVREKGTLTFVALLGLAVPVGLTLSLWGTVGTSFNGTLVVDQFAVFFKLLVLIAVFLVILGSQDYLNRFTRFSGEYYGLILLAAAGMMLVAGARDLITIYLSLELTTFSIVALTAFLKDSKSSESAIKYLLLSAIASAIMLYGMALVFGLTGTTQLAGIAARVQELGLVPEQGNLLQGGALVLGFLFMVVGFGFKIAAVPFQMWVPDVYEGAPTPVTAYLSVASKAAGFAVLLRVFYEAFPDLQTDWLDLIAVLAVISMFVGNLVAMVQSNIKRMLGYSTIAHAGYMMIGVAVATELGQSGVLFYLAAYTLTNLGAFIAIIALSNRVGSDEISSFAGLGRSAVFPAFVLTLCLISLTGAPPTAGFMGKIYLFNAAVSDGLVWLAVVGVVNSVISAYYYWKVIRVLYQSPTTESEAAPPRTFTAISPSAAMQASLGIAVVGVLALGIAPGVVISWATEAVAVLMALPTIASGL